MMKLHHQRYGKQRVRVLRRIRHENGQYDIIEVKASLLLEGDFEVAYLTDDNIPVVPTDTVKNTIHALAKNHLQHPIERFALTLAKHFLDKYVHVERVLVDLEAKPWGRFSTSDGIPQPLTFLSDADHGTPFTQLVATRTECSVKSGVSDLLVFKATDSAFIGYPKCEYTTLKETTDRILASSMHATWTFTSTAPSAAWLEGALDFSKVRATTLSTLLDVFSREFSPSVQNTIYLMSTAALKAVPEIGAVRIAMPNKHYLPIDLSPFGLPNENDLFLPTDEPHGQIEATITRGD